MDMDEIFDKIKSYADAAVGQAGKFGKAAATKTENVVSQAKLKYAINETERQIKSIYTALGEKVYLKYLEGEGNITGDWAEDCEKISSFNEELETLNVQLADLKESVKCEYCGAYNSVENAYCAKCGAKLAEPETDDTTEADIEEASDNIANAANATAETIEETVEEAAAVVENYG